MRFSLDHDRAVASACRTPWAVARATAAAALELGYLAGTALEGGIDISALRIADGPWSVIWRLAPLTADGRVARSEGCGGSRRQVESADFEDTKELSMDRSSRIFAPCAEGERSSYRGATTTDNRWQPAARRQFLPAGELPSPGMETPLWTALRAERDLEMMLVGQLRTWRYSTVVFVAAHEAASEIQSVAAITDRLKP
jgi:hypothetical protein